MSANDNAVLETIRSLGGLSTALQPIFEVTRKGARLHGVELFIRGPKGTRFEAAGTLLEFVKKQGARVFFDRVCLDVVLRSAASLSAAPKISVNVHAVTLCEDSTFAAHLETLLWDLGIKAHRVTVEIGDLDGYEDDPRLTAGAERLRRAGVGIALDESGFGDGSFALFLSLRPDYVKVDRLLVHGPVGEPERCAMLEGLVEIGRKLGFRVVAEGVEDLKDLRQMSRVGIDLVQGFHFAYPLPANTWRLGALLPCGNVWESFTMA